MTALVSDRGEPRSLGEAVGRGMEQFHHPRPVCTGKGEKARPTVPRERLVTGLTGRVLEIGAGDGVKLTFFPADLEEIVLVEPDPFLRAVARRSAAGARTPVRIVDGTASRLPIPDASCDAVVCSLILCCAPRLEVALHEVRRVLRPGGELRFHEHQRSAHPVVALAESAVTPLWSRVCGGCHLARDVVAAIERAGFVVERLDHFSFCRVSHVVGVARAAREE
ncbi:class I SAM-dependent methyltransferase [Streptosporangium sp. NPDC051022]|uniref:class I SAM-dependent methyltransferase n=1 Tax=Streptosporangium sp. NPDC051022 TaxID=3155752 RepID=UPI00344AEE2F